MKAFDSEVRSHNLTTIEVAVRWIAHHSALGNEDGIILGASKAEQIRETVGMIKKGPLDEQVLRATENIWSKLQETRGNIM